jgi:hypothetical protein
MPSPALSQLHNHASEALRITRKRFLGPPFTHLLCSQRFVKLSWNVVGSGQRIRSKILRLAALSSAHGDAVAAQLHRARTSGPSYEHTAPCERLVAPSSAAASAVAATAMRAASPSPQTAAGDATPTGTHTTACIQRQTTALRSRGIALSGDMAGNVNINGRGI